MTQSIFEIQADFCKAMGNATRLQFLGYTNVRNLNGGMNGWIAAELPVVK